MIHEKLLTQFEQTCKENKISFNSVIMWYLTKQLNGQYKTNKQNKQNLANFIKYTNEDYDLLWDLQPEIEEDEEHAFAVQHIRDLLDVLLGGNEMLEYITDEDELQSYRNCGFDISTPQETANAFGKKVKAKDKIFTPKKHANYYIMHYNKETTEEDITETFITKKQALKKFKLEQPYEENDRVELVYSPEDANKPNKILKKKEI